MRRLCTVLLVLVPLVAAGVLRGGGAPPPAWAYNIPPAPPPGTTPAPPAPDDGALKTLPGSSAKFTLTQIRDAFGPADWYPGDHPTMPDIVAHGPRPHGASDSLHT